MGASVERWAYHLSVEHSCVGVQQSRKDGKEDPSTELVVFDCSSSRESPTIEYTSSAPSLSGFFLNNLPVDYLGSTLAQSLSLLRSQSRPIMLIVGLDVQCDY
jgi:hypothetical protein